VRVLDHRWLSGARRTGVGLTGLVALLMGFGAMDCAGSSPAEAEAASADAALEVSFDPAAEVRLRGQRFVSLAGADLEQLNALVGQHTTAKVERAFRRSEASLDAVRERVRGKGHRDVPDLNRHYRILATDVAERDALITQLRALAVVDQVIAEPEPTPPPLTPNFFSQQRYGAPGPVGIDVAAFAQLPGGRGERVKIVDVEYSWNQAHEDLAAAMAPGAMIANGTPQDPSDGSDHGTAVLGELIGSDNGWGVTGLAPRSAVAMVNAYVACTAACWRLPDAITLAHENMAPGDVMLVEQQYKGPEGKYVPVEFWPAVYDAIRLATQDGMIVVEAAGNGEANLDSSVYGSPFPSGRSDSGAIIVGAGSGDCTAPANSRLPFSTYGSRVNLQGWGQCVTTTGYGWLFHGGSADSLYTDRFGGTSSASPMVAAAAALYSSVHEATRGAPPTPQLVRSRLVATGTPQAGASPGHIGPLPNLGAAAADFSSARPDNLIANPSFEANTAGWGSFGGSLSRLSVSGAPDGAWVVRAQWATGTSYSVSDNVGTAPTIPSVTAGSTYVASCQMRAATSQAIGRPVRIVLRERVGTTGTVVKETVATSTLTGTFARLSVAAVAVTTGNTMGVRCEQTSAVAGDAFDADLMTLAPASTVGGNTTAGSVWTTASPNGKRASSFALTAPKDVVALQAHVDGKGAASGSQPVTGVLYAGTASGPTTRIGTTTAATISAGRSAAWLRLSFATPIRLAAGTYWIGLHTGGTSGVMRFAATAVAGALRFNTDTYSDGAAAAFGTASTDAKSLSVYAVGSWAP
jgi:serine protease